MNEIQNDDIITFLHYVQVAHDIKSKNKNFDSKKVSSNILKYSFLDISKLKKNFMKIMKRILVMKVIKIKKSLINFIFLNFQIKIRKLFIKIMPVKILIKKKEVENDIDK